MSTLTMQHARRLWEYLSSFKTRAPCDVAVVCCSYELRVGDYACELLESGLTRRLESWQYLFGQFFKNHLIPNRPVDMGKV